MSRFINNSWLWRTVCLLQASLAQSTTVVSYQCQKKNKDKEYYEKTRGGMKIKKALSGRKKGTRNWVNIMQKTLWINTRVKRQLIEE